MHRPARIGDTGELQFEVELKHAIDFYDEQMPAILSTPQLIYALENAGRNALAPLLEEHETCVGVHVDVEHLAPSPLGEMVTCRARVIQVDGAVVNFQVEAFDSQERIARGLHKRAVLEIERIARRIRKKM